MVYLWLGVFISGFVFQSVEKVQGKDNYECYVLKLNDDALDKMDVNLGS